MVVTIREAACLLGVSDRKIRQMITEGLIPARPSAGSWAIDDTDLPALPRVAPALSERVAWAAIVGPWNVHWLTKTERVRLLRMLRRAIFDGDVLRLASWLAGRGSATRYTVADQARLYSDPRLVPSGVSDPRVRAEPCGDLEFYAQPGQLQAVIADHQLTPDPAGALMLREAGWELPRPAPALLVVVDLVDHGLEDEAQRILGCAAGTAGDQVAAEAG